MSGKNLSNLSAQRSYPVYISSGGGGGGGATVSDAINGQHGIGTSGSDYIIYSTETSTGDFQNSLQGTLHYQFNDLAGSRTVATFDIPSDWTVCRFQLYIYNSSNVTELFSSNNLCCSVLATTDYNTGTCISAPNFGYTYLGGVLSYAYRPYEIIGKTYEQIGQILKSGNRYFFTSPCITYFIGGTYYRLPNSEVDAYIETVQIENGKLKVTFVTTDGLNRTFPSYGYLAVVSKVPS